MNHIEYQNYLLIGGIIIGTSIAVSSLIGGYYLVGGIFALF
jgi:hypothetical protein